MFITKAKPPLVRFKALYVLSVLQLLDKLTMTQELKTGFQLANVCIIIVHIDIKSFDKNTSPKSCISVNETTLHSIFNL